MYRRRGRVVQFLRAVRSVISRAYKKERSKMSVGEQLERLQDRDGRFSVVVRLFQCITGPRLRRQYFVGEEATVSVYRVGNI